MHVLIVGDGVFQSRFKAAILEQRLRATIRTAATIAEAKQQLSAVGGWPLEVAIIDAHTPLVTAAERNEAVIMAEALELAEHLSQNDVWAVTIHEDEASFRDLPPEDGRQHTHRTSPHSVINQVLANRRYWDGLYIDPRESLPGSFDVT